MLDQRKLTEDLLFNHYMISSTRENQIFSTIPYYLEEDLFNLMKDYGETLDKLLVKIMKGIKGEFKEALDYIEDFPFKEKIINLRRPLVPIFWTRYDTFIKDEKGIFFCEFNYDKPCAQREIIFSNKLNPKNNPNTRFESLFKEKFKEICIKNLSIAEDEECINVAILIDPCHYEECHLSYLFKDILEEIEGETRFKIIPVGPKNLKVQEEKLLAFGKEIKVLLRLFPTEYLYEVNDFEQILELFDDEKILILNDPRVIIAQAKSIFAYLWYLVKEKPHMLEENEIEAIKNAIPYTKIFEEADSIKLIDSKDKYVIKPLLGRYSEDVYIGKLMDEKEWIDIVNNIGDEKRLYVIQQFYEIRKERTFYVDEGFFNVPCEAYGNFGTYIIDGSFVGTMIRWSDDYLTLEDTTWITPIGIEKKSCYVKEMPLENRKEKWKEVYDEAMAKYDFTGAYSGEKEYVSLEPFIIDKDLNLEILEASKKITEILKKTQELILKNHEIFFPLMNIDERLYEVILNSFTDSFCAIGRMDWVINLEGELKLLEFNSETPAGLVEAIGLNSIIKEKLGYSFKDCNVNLPKEIKKTLTKILEDFNKVKALRNIAFLSSTYYEDWYNTKILKEIISELPYNFVMGNIYDINLKDDKIYLYGEEIDAIYRYYPLDWFVFETSMDKFLEPLKGETLSINPTHTMVTQNKAIFAIIYELKNQGFFSEEEEKYITKYLPYTSLDKDSKLSKDFCIKPFLSREGEGVAFSFQQNLHRKEGFIFQDRVNIKSFPIDIHKALGRKKVNCYPIIGVFIAGEEPCGIYTRFGDLVTDKNAVYLPTYEEEV